MNPDRFSVVLVEPQGAMNIGSVCRVMMNFGFSDLRLVNPQADHLSKPALDMAVKAKVLLHDASIHPSLANALSDCHMVIGTTRRYGKYRDDFIYPEDIDKVTAHLDAGNHVALVFGREDSGLTTAELDLCRQFLTIPTDDHLPSMNLAQAVSVCLYELSKSRLFAKRNDDEKKLADSETVESMFQHMRETLTSIEYLDQQNPDHILRTFRRIFGRAGLDERETRILRGLWNRIDWLRDQL
ncbi:MAG: RNA methyltransferase [Desulfobulbaceae bacterium]|nr:RNA methyltransferase [Desulfobulbaceae bacterium]